MRNAALTLGIIAGICGMIVGLFGYGYVELTRNFAELGQSFGTFADPDLVRIVSIVSPMLAIGGGAMAKSHALWGGIALLVSAAGFWAAFGFGVFSMVPICFAGAAGVLALLARRPDEPRAHF